MKNLMVDFLVVILAASWMVGMGVLRYAFPVVVIVGTLRWLGVL